MRTRGVVDSPSVSEAWSWHRGPSGPARRALSGKEQTSREGFVPRPTTHFRLPILLAFALLATACQIRFDTAVVVNDDGSGTFAIEISLDEEFRQLSEENEGEFSFTDAFEEDPPEGWIVEPFVDGEFEGARIATDFASLDDLNAKLAQLSALAEEDESPTDLFGEMVIEQEGDTFSFRAGADGLSETLLSDGDSGFEGFDPAALFESLFVIRLLVTLPGEPGDHNADELDEGTFIWNIGLEDEGTDFFASSTIAGGGFNPLVIVVLVIAIAGAVFWMLSRKQEEGSSSIVDYVPPTED